MPSRRVGAAVLPSQTPTIWQPLARGMHGALPTAQTLLQAGIHGPGLAGTSDKVPIPNEMPLPRGHDGAARCQLWQPARGGTRAEGARLPCIYDPWAPVGPGHWRTTP